MSKRFPWHLVVLLGSGFTLAKACKVKDSLLNSRRSTTNYIQCNYWKMHYKQIKYLLSWIIVIINMNVFQESGLSKWVGTQLAHLDAIPSFGIVICVCVMITTFTEFTSNVATAIIFLPILAFLVSFQFKSLSYFYFICFLHLVEQAWCNFSFCDAICET